MKIPAVAADLFRAVAPTLGLALGGPMGVAVATLAVKALDAWIVPRGPGPPTPEDVVAAVEKNAGNPDFALDLKRAELAVKDYELRMKKLDHKFDLMRLQLQDRDSARAFIRDTGAATFVQKLGLVALVWDAVVTAGVLVGAFVMMTGIVRIGDPSVFAAVMGFVGLVVGRVSNRAETYWNFLFGSSQGSKDKTEALTGSIREISVALADAETRRPPEQPIVLNNLPAPPAALPAPQEGPWLQGPHGGQRWRLAAEGVVLEGDTAPLRTVGQPATVRRIWREHGHLIERVCAEERVPLEILVATVAVESAGRADAVRHESNGRASGGLTQTLVDTAREALGNPGLELQDLLNPETALRAGARYIAKQRPLTSYQPPLVAAAYNAGGLYPPREGDANPWRLRSTGDHITRLCQFYGDAAAVAAEDGWGRVDKAA